MSFLLFFSPIFPLQVLRLHPPVALFFGVAKLVVDRGCSFFLLSFVFSYQLCILDQSHFLLAFVKCVIVYSVYLIVLELHQILQHNSFLPCLLRRKNFILESTSGKFEVKEGQRLVGNCHLAQRDPALWATPGCSGPEDFDPSRFQKKVWRVSFTNSLTVHSLT